MKKDLGSRLLEILREQRKYFIRLADGQKLITNNLMYNSLEEESYQLQLKIGAENKKILIKQGIYIKNKI